MFTKMYLYIFMYIYIYTCISTGCDGVWICCLYLRISVLYLYLPLCEFIYSTYIQTKSWEAHFERKALASTNVVGVHAPLAGTPNVWHPRVSEGPFSNQLHDTCLRCLWNHILLLIYIHNSLDVENSPVICWCLFVLCNAESPFQQEMRRECVPDYVAPSLGHVMGIDWDLPTFWIFRWLFEDHAPVGRRTNMIKIWSLRTTIDYSERRLKYVEDLK